MTKKDFQCHVCNDGNINMGKGGCPVCGKEKEKKDE